MFDVNDPADLAALKSEVNTDPIGMGYDPVGATQQLLMLLNDPANNVGGETAGRPFDKWSILDALDPTEFDDPQTQGGAAEYVAILIDSAIDEDIEALAPYKSKFESMFHANSATRIALNAQTKALSRAEVLFGIDTEISRSDWFAARDS